MPIRQKERIGITFATTDSRQERCRSCHSRIKFGKLCSSCVHLVLFISAGDVVGDDVRQGRWRPGDAGGALQRASEDVVDFLVGELRLVWRVAGALLCRLGGRGGRLGVLLLVLLDRRRLLGCCGDVDGGVVVGRVRCRPCFRSCLRGFALEEGKRSRR